MLIELTGVLKRRRKELNSQSAFDAFQLVVKENNEDAYKDFLLCERSARSGFVRNFSSGKERFRCGSCSACCICASAVVIQ
jgi:hypothetical protein